MNSLILDTDKTAKGKGKLIPLTEITVLNWIKDLIPPRSEEEQRLLLENLEDNGQQTPVLVTQIDDQKYILVDGHGRYEALQQLKESSIWVVSQKFKDEQAIKDAMLRIQLGRRNLSENVKIRLIGEIWNRRDGGQTDPLTRKELATQSKTSESTVKRAAKYAQAIADIESVIPGAKAIMDDPTTPRAIALQLAPIARENPNRAREILDKVAAEESDKAKNKVFRNAIVADQKGGGQTDPQVKKVKSQKINISAEIVALVSPIAKSNNLPLATQIENLIKEHLAEINE
jgi:ParB-like chromosome segregation protein Spo0J